MGMYCTIVGTVTFKKKEEFDAFLNKMIEGGWYDKEKDCWIDDCDQEASNEDVVDDDNLSIEFPNWNMNNIHRLVNLLENMDWDGELRGVTEDGCFEGWVTRPKQEDYTVDLKEWADEHGMQLPWDEDIQDYETDFRCEVMDSFLDNPFPLKVSQKYVLED